MISPKPLNHSFWLQLFQNSSSVCNHWFNYPKFLVSNQLCNLYQEYLVELQQILSTFNNLKSAETCLMQCMNTPENKRHKLGWTCQEQKLQLNYVKRACMWENRRDDKCKWRNGKNVPALLKAVHPSYTVFFFFCHVVYGHPHFLLPSVFIARPFLGTGNSGGVFFWSTWQIHFKTLLYLMIFQLLSLYNIFFFIISHVTFSWGPT